MKRITKEMCMIYIKDHYKSNLIGSILSVFAVVTVGFFTKNVMVAAIVAALAFVIIFFIIKTTTKRIENVNLNDFYLVEDVLVDCQKRISTKASGGSGHNYIYTFRDNGKYTIHKSVHPTVEIPLHKEKDIDHLSVEKLCLESCENGDMYYLLIEKKNERTKIVKCFPKYNFDILQEDFDYIDGKYYCKKWYDDYEKLDLSDGKISFILEDDEDMIEIHYKDGMLIDVGYIEHMHSYFITVVSSDSDEGWKNPLEEIQVEDKTVLADKIQETIYKYRR